MHCIEQRKHMPIGARLFQIGVRSVERRLHISQIHPKPRPQPVSETMDFTDARDRSERHCVEIIEDDLRAFAPGIASGMVCFETRGDNLSKFFSWRGRAS